MLYDIRVRPSAAGKQLRGGLNWNNLHTNRSAHIKGYIQHKFLRAFVSLVETFGPLF